MRSKLAHGPTCSISLSLYAVDVAVYEIVCVLRARSGSGLAGWYRQNSGFPSIYAIECRARSNANRCQSGGGGLQPHTKQRVG